MGTGIDVTTQVANGVLDALEYQDPILYQQEIATVFRKSWLIVARSSEIPSAGDWTLYEGHGESVIATRQPDGSVAAFHNVCMHRGVRLTHGETSGCTRRFTCPYHGWVYDTKGALVGLPDREDFASELVAGQTMPAIAAQEWAGFVWINLAGEHAPTLEEWTGPEIPADLAGFAMENMVLLEKQEFILDVNYKAVVDAFNEVYHAVTLHHTGAEWGRAAKDTAYHLFGPNSMRWYRDFVFWMSCVKLAITIYTQSVITWCSQPRSSIAIPIKSRSSTRCPLGQRRPNLCCGNLSTALGPKKPMCSMHSTEKQPWLVGKSCKSLLAKTS
jgi:phenylpropionate dioxygenase-like ring-hydroxylating dioxygenase large terminal subunit